VVFLDTVGSTQIASELGDERWQTLLQRELQILRRLLKEKGGREVDVAGDGLFALFDEPAAAVRFAASAVEAVREIGVEVRAGVHFGEVEFSDGHPAGIVVHTGARAMGLGGAGQVLVTQTVRDLVAGGHLRFADHGTHELKGITGTWSLFLLTEIDREQMAPPLDDEEASSRREQASEPPPLVRRRTFLVGAGAGAVAIGTAGFLLTHREKPPREAVRPPVQNDNRLFRYVPDTGALTPMPGVYGGSGFLPSVAVGEGAVWTGDLYLHHVDPDDGSEGDPIVLGRADSDFVYGVTIDFDDVWVASGSGLYQIDPGDDEELGFRGGLQGGATTVATGFGSVWVGNWSGFLFRIEPSGKLPVITSLHVGAVVSGIVATQESMWISDEFGVVIPVDPTTNEQKDPVAIGGTPKGLTATNDRLWVVDSDSRNVRVVDIEARKELKTINIDGDPVDVVAGLDAVWVADTEGRIVKIDTALQAVVDEKAIDGPAAALAIDEAEGVIWIRTGRER
jgi:hypothetical protein